MMDIDIHELAQVRVQELTHCLSLESFIVATALEGRNEFWGIV